MGLLPEKSYIDDICPICGSKLYVTYDEIINEKLKETTHERTVHCEGCNFTEKRMFEE